MLFGESYADKNILLILKNQRTENLNLKAYWLQWVEYRGVGKHLTTYW